MLNYLKNESNYTYTENGGTAYRSTNSFCLDMFFKAGAMRNSTAEEIADVVTRAYAENPDKTMKIVFFVRDARGGLGERRFFRCAVSALVKTAPKAVEKNIPLFAEYGRYDDLCVLLGTPLEKAAAKEIKAQLDKDIAAMERNGQASLLAKWLPSVNASSKDTRNKGRRMAALLGMSEPAYRRTLSSLRAYTDILENRLRERDYTFNYEVQPSCAMFKYRRAFIRNDNERYVDYLNSVHSGEAKLNADRLFPYDIVRAALTDNISETERMSLDAAWKSLPDLTASRRENAIAVIDGSGSMACGCGIRPIDAALSLGIYFAEHNTGAFANHFITFSESPRIVEIKGNDIVEKVRYCDTFNEVANTNLEAVFLLILRTAKKHRVSKEEMPSKVYIISDMQFDYCIVGGNDESMFREMRKLFRANGYELPDIVFWNVNSRCDAMPVTRSETGAALVSGYSPAVFDMVIGGNISPEAVMDKILASKRYAPITAA
ncbi:DUF2828 family protein [Ruminococcus flavefaciens]|uniref:DUF2828 family protein n=1 Tax=Ruminococcus flavefaciens TaxID=1265 RepID=A0A1K1MGX7_RUMFL|nr:DUF2828 family protein [Ruminococcus flavefaciens]SFW22394.1 protein of unknown function [Ruminococcus flavefaciens]